MAHEIKIRKAGGTWVVRAGGAVIGESKRALELSENGYPNRIYFPRDDIAMAFLDKSEKSTSCPFKGEASYLTIVTKSTTIKDAAWSYDAPEDEVADIAGHICFFENDRVAVEQL
ncbi:MAG: DUF427 domain-containing protein [Boseongicola sp.]